MIGALFPSRLVTDFRRTQQACTVASVAMLCNHVSRLLGTTRAASGSGNLHTFAFFPLDADLANGFEALGDFVGGRRLGTDCP